MKTAGIPKGFTLVEILIVMALITILASFAAPAWQHYTKNTHLKTATREIVADILQTRQRAIAENINTYQLTFNVGGNTYSLSRSDTGVTLWTKNLTSFGPEVQLQDALMSGGGSVLSFQRRGTMSPMPGSIRVRNTLASWTRINVQMIGRPYVEYFMQK